uniref:Uncharacterized protein n=1 Tax=Glossina brevipalpis TaxID=37001 RepID=A0A1A9WBH1_9MUSC
MNGYDKDKITQRFNDFLLSSQYFIPYKKRKLIAEVLICFNVFAIFLRTSSCRKCSFSRQYSSNKISYNEHPVNTTLISLRKDALDVITFSKVFLYSATNNHKHLEGGGSLSFCDTFISASWRRSSQS